ncbi:MAG: GDP-mannose 4,6-dehydratase [Candidatus Omnitrophota bacterium]
MKWKNKQVLVTGAAGFIGSHLVQRLLDLGVKVRAFIRYDSQGDLGNLVFLPQNQFKKIEIIRGDIRELQSVKEAIKGTRIIFHLCALAGIPYSYVHPREVFETNCLGTLNVLTGGLELQVDKVILTSTSETYGTARYVPIDENHPLQPQSPYSASKISADMLGLSFYNSFNLPVSIIRPFNTYGPRQSARAIIPTIIAQILTGNSVHIGSVFPTRDFTYVTDTAEGFIKVAECEKAIGQAINLGTGFEISIADLTDKIISIVGNKHTRILADKARMRPKKSEVGRLCSDNSKARRLLKWEPGISLDEGLKKTVSWIKENIDLYEPQAYKI